jgi:hypothetical protein
VRKTFNIIKLWLISIRFCIDADKPDEKHDQIRRMGDIYRAAEFTIVAAPGSSGAAGIPGVGSSTRDPQHTSRMKKITLLPTLPHPTFSISNTTWATRGWTYQEAVLSRRRIVFTSQQVYFECGAMQCVEALDHYATPRKDSGLFGNPSASALFYRTGQFSGDNEVIPFGYRNMRNKFQSGKKDNVLSALERLWHQIEEYSSRQLTFDHDGLNAFVGILGDACLNNKLVLYHVMGLPVLLASMHFMMLQTLLWSTGRFKQSTSNNVSIGAFTLSDPSIRRPSLPSWSWAGWRATIQQPEVKIPKLDWSFTTYFWPRETSDITSVWLARLTLENSLGDTLHCGESQARLWKKLPTFEKTVYLHLEAYSCSFKPKTGYLDSGFRMLHLTFKETSPIEREDNLEQWCWDKIANAKWVLTVESSHRLLGHLARKESLLIPLMANPRCIYLMLVDIVAGDLVERRGIIRFDRLSSDETRVFSVSNQVNMEELRLSPSRMVMVV